MAQVFATSGIATRHVARPLHRYPAPHGWEDRNTGYLDAAPTLFRAAALRALASAGRTAAEMDVILTASCTGIATPGIKARLAEGIEFRPAALHMPTFGWGCAGGAPRLALAVTLLNAVAMPVRIPAKAWALRRG